MELVTSSWGQVLIHSLSFRLLTAFTLVIIVIVGSAFFFAHRNTRIEIERLTERVEDMQTRRLKDELTSQHLRQGSWEEVQPVVLQWGRLFGRRVILTDVRDMVIADSESEIIGEVFWRPTMHFVIDVPFMD